MAARNPPHPVTLTHARLRAHQGDRRGAVVILERLLEECPDDLDLRRLLEDVRRGPVRDAPEALDEAPAPRAAASAGEIAAEFRRELGRPTSARRRIQRLERWLARVTTR